MIDTENKRRSALGHGVLSLTVRPVPARTIGATERRHSSALYSGIETVIDTFLFWREHKESSGTFVKHGGASWTTASSRSASGSWSKVNEIED